MTDIIFSDNIFDNSINFRTTVFELLRTKPDLVEAGRTYHEKMKRESLSASAIGNPKSTAATKASPQKQLGQREEQLDQ